MIFHSEVDGYSIELDGDFFTGICPKKLICRHGIYGIPITTCELRVSSCVFRVASFELRVSG